MKLYLATGNPHKVAELTAILAAAQLPVEVLPPSAVGGMPHVDEDTGTFEGNARKKALALAARIPPAPAARTLSRSRQSSCRAGIDALAVADDSGVCVDALDGAPGVESAYFAGHPSNDAANIARLLTALHDVPAENRTAAFFCCIVAAAPDGRTFTFEGRCPGRVLAAARGAGGFGYDPIFRPDGFEQSYAELGPEVKHRISHRARALAEFVRWLKAQR